MRIFLSILVLLFSVNCFASEKNVEACVSCTYEQKEWLANNYALGQAVIGKSDFHVLDLSNYSFQSFEVSKNVNPLYPAISDQEYLISVTDKTPPQELISISNALIGAEADIEAAVNSNNIPTSVLGDPWEYVNCAYCMNDIQAYIRDVGTITAAVENIEHLFESIGILSTGSPNTYEMSLAAGGTVAFKLEIGNNGKIIIKITKVIDGNNNTVPARATARMPNF